MVICGKFFHVLIVACYVPVAPLGLRCTGFWRFYTPFTPLGLLEAGAHCAPYKCTFQTGSYCAYRTADTNSQTKGKCAGCNYHFPFRNMTIDHILAQAKSGTDHKDNLQLLCSACNSTKGTGTQEELISTLKARGDLTA